VIAEVEKALITMDEYFNKINNKMIKSLDKIENETDNIELEINRQLQYIETYRCTITTSTITLLYQILKRVAVAIVINYNISTIITQIVVCYVH